MTRATRGGARPGAGRPREYREPLYRVTVTLPGSYIDQLRAYGNRNLSDGVRRLVEECRTPSGDFWYRMPDQRGVTERPPIANSTAFGSTAPRKEERGGAGIAPR